MARTDDFPNAIKDILAHRSGYRCAMPTCRAPTAGPGDESAVGRTSLGVAAHITAASAGGPRFDATMDSEIRRSVLNGIWLCQNHAKEIDDNPNRFSADRLRGWKAHAEQDARAMLGRPISAQAIDASMEVSLHRLLAEEVVVRGSTTLPTGTKLMVKLRRDGYHATAHAVVLRGSFVAGAFTDHGQPLPHDWYDVEVLVVFNQAWQQPPAVQDIVGVDGQLLAGRFAEPVYPDIDEPHMRFRAEFECTAPPLSSESNCGDDGLAEAVKAVRASYLTVDGVRSANSVDEVVAFFLTTPGVQACEGWAAAQGPTGSISVLYSFRNAGVPDIARWEVILRTGAVKYRNLRARQMSWLPAD